MAKQECRTGCPSGPSGQQEWWQSVAASLQPGRRVERGGFMKRNRVIIGRAMQVAIPSIFTVIYLITLFVSLPACLGDSAYEEDGEQSDALLVLRCCVSVIYAVVIGNYVRAAFGEPGGIEESWRRFNARSDDRRLQPLLPTHAQVSEQWAQRMHDAIQRTKKPKVQPHGVKLRRGAGGVPVNTAEKNRWATSLEEVMRTGAPIMLMKSDKPDKDEEVLDKATEWHTLDFNGDEIALKKEAAPKKTSTKKKLDLGDDDDFLTDLGISAVSPTPQSDPEAPNASVASAETPDLEKQKADVAGLLKGMGASFADIQFAGEVPQVFAEAAAQHESIDLVAVHERLRQAPLPSDTDNEEEDAEESKSADEEEEDNQKEEPELQIDWIDIKQCDKCDSARPPRARHCSACKRCVARMDHHCIWLGTCVGCDNYKFFIALIADVFIACLIVLPVTLVSLFQVSNSALFYLVPTCCLAAFGVFFTYKLLEYHLPLLLRNQTQLEKMFAPVAFEHKYSLGTQLANLRLTMGDFPLLWLLPVRSGVVSTDVHDVRVLKFRLQDWTSLSLFVSGDLAVILSCFGVRSQRLGRVPPNGMLQNVRAYQEEVSLQSPLPAHQAPDGWVAESPDELV
ncbi:MAG: hypothetical protein MHM6MM_000317 [Cercozoa sp. M6MM]